MEALACARAANLHGQFVVRVNKRWRPSGPEQQREFKSINTNADKSVDGHRPASPDVSGDRLYPLQARTFIIIAIFAK